MPLTGEWYFLWSNVLAFCTSKLNPRQRPTTWLSVCRGREPHPGPAQPSSRCFSPFTETWCFTTLSCSNSNLPSLSFLHFLHSLFPFLPLHLLRILTVLFLIHKLDKNIIKPANSYTKTSHQLCVLQMTEVYTGTWFRDWCWTNFKKSHSWQRWHWPVKFCSIVLLSS